MTAPRGQPLMKPRKYLRKHKIEKLPIVDSEGNLKGAYNHKGYRKAIEFPNLQRIQEGRLLAGAAVGVTSDMMERVKALVDVKVDVITLDSAHGHSKNIIEGVKRIKDAYPDIQVIAGNVATAEATEN